MEKIETNKKKIVFFCGKSHFEDDDTQIFFVFQPIHRYFRIVNANDSNIYHGNLKDYLMKALRHLLHQIKSLIIR